MKYKNLVIVTIIFVLPVLAYFLLSQSDESIAKRSEYSKTQNPEIVKFTSLMCLDCKKLDKTMKEVYPKYSEKITLTEVQVQNNDKKTQEQIEKYNVSLVPTVILLDKKGKKINKIEGYIEKERLEKIMKDMINE